MKTIYYANALDFGHNIYPSEGLKTDMANKIIDMISSKNQNTFIHYYSKKFPNELFIKPYNKNIVGDINVEKIITDIINGIENYNQNNSDIVPIIFYDNKQKIISITYIPYDEYNSGKPSIRINYHKHVL
jgi:hypothetical protein